MARTDSSRKEDISMARFTKKTDLIEIEVDGVLQEREKSLIVAVGDREVLIPKSQIGETSEVRERGDKGLLVIPRWLAKDRRLV